MVNHDRPEDSPVMNETLSVIDEHMIDLKSPRPILHERRPTNDSGSEYSSFLDHRVSYIAGQETDEEENNLLTESEVLTWGPSQVAEHLEDIGVDPRHCAVFKEQDISGEVLLAMDQATIFMKEFDLGLVGQRLRTWHKIKALQDEVRGKNTVPSRQVSGLEAPANEKVAGSASRRSTTRQSRAATNPQPVRQDFMESQLSNSIPNQTPSRDSTSTPSISFKSGLDSPSRPSAASIREYNHSRRHSNVEYGAPFSPSSTNDQSNPGTPQMPVANPLGQGYHKKTPSMDRNWSMGSPTTTAGARPFSTMNAGDTFYMDRRTPDLPSHRASHVPSGSRDLDRGYKSGDELDMRRARNVLRKRDTISTTHSRQSSYQGDIKPITGSSAKRHSRFGSVDSIRDTMAAIAHHSPKIGSPKLHNRTSSASEAVVKPEPSSDETGTPAVTRLEYGTKSSMKIITSSNRDSGVGLNHSPKSGAAKAFSKPRMGLRAISDAVTGGEKTVAASPSLTSPTLASPLKESSMESSTRSGLTSPVKEVSTESPARTGSTTPSAASQSIDRESTDASSKGTSGPHSANTAPIQGPRRKSKKETSAYIRGLEQKSPQEQMIDCDYSGWMKKKSSNMMTTWKQRLFVLRGRRLSYYYDEDDAAEKGLIDISSHRVLPADHDILTGIHATVTGAKSSPVSPPTAYTPTLAATEAAAQTESTLHGTINESTFIFKLVPPRTGFVRGVNFTKPTVHYFAVDNIRQGRLWMAALMKATIDRDESKPITTSYQLKTISLAKARIMKQRPPALMNLEENNENVQDGPKSDETGLNIQGLDLKLVDSNTTKRTGSLDTLSKSSDLSRELTREPSDKA